MSVRKVWICTQTCLEHYTVALAYLHGHLCSNATGSFEPWWSNIYHEMKIENFRNDALLWSVCISLISLSY